MHFFCKTPSRPRLARNIFFKQVSFVFVLNPFGRLDNRLSSSFDWVATRKNDFFFVTDRQHAKIRISDLQDLKD
jgi:hypothetical protein